jgi:3-oxoacyl-[acyl-carrier protein] reductase
VTAGKVALVLAASQGLGRASAESLAAAGFDVAVCSRTEEGVAATVSALEALGVRATGIPTDVTDTDQLEALFAHVDATFGRLDVLVTNAGGPPAGGFEQLDDAAWSKGYELTLMSTVRAIRLAIPRMRAAGYGRIIVIGSSSVRRPIPGLLLSNAYRPALAGVVKSLAVDLGPEGITVNMVSPGRILTERVQEIDAKRAESQGIDVSEVRRASEATIPFGRYGDPVELGAAVAFIASPAASYMTGQSLLIDGGLVPTLP